MTTASLDFSIRKKLVNEQLRNMSQLAYKVRIYKDQFEFEDMCLNKL